jgi:hypothetical protein
MLPPAAASIGAAMNEAVRELACGLIDGCRSLAKRRYP